ncbi:hypothetical protein [Comamonas antarctica]|uniref:hypothetical protein n=1 Tax=Comamonas antarctica TaxID=2743470 RepID=UPI001587DA4C|nr:hypothetical protein [Comamonas antarctica]
MFTAGRSYVGPDLLEQDTAQPLLPAMVPAAPRATGETLMAALAADAQSQLMLDRRLIDAVERAEPLEVWRLLKGGANVNFVDSRTGVTPLIVAMSMPFGNTMKILLAHGADPNFINPFDGNTPRWSRSTAATFTPSGCWWNMAQMNILPIHTTGIPPGGLRSGKGLGMS